MKLIPILLLVLSVRLYGGQAVPSAETIISKVIERSEQASKAKECFAYQRVSRVDYLNDDGVVKKNVVRVYNVTPENGKPVSKLILINGKPATDKDDSNRSAVRETGDKGRTLNLGADLLTRYNYFYRGEENNNGRPVWVLDFFPKSDIENDGFMDRLLNGMQGTIWVDQEDYDFAKLVVHLGKKISFFGGLAGAIDKLDMQLTQRRVDPAVWMTENLTLDFSGRKLFSSIRFQCFELYSGFRAVANHKKSDQTTE